MGESGRDASHKFHYSHSPCKVGALPSHGLSDQEEEKVNERNMARFGSTICVESQSHPRSFVEKIWKEIKLCSKMFRTFS